ncbi:MAG: hypothetical protein RIS79_2083, partial [Verrucomicrobiota bacterium]
MYWEVLDIQKHSSFEVFLAAWTEFPRPDADVRARRSQSTDKSRWNQWI